MYGNYMNNEACGLWDGLLQRGAMAARNRLHMDNVTGLINILAGCMPQKSSTACNASGKLYKAYLDKDACRPCGYAVSIAVEMLPGKNKRYSGKNKNQRV